MATLTAFKFPTPDGAERALATVRDLQRQQLITIQDAAIVSWPADKKKPTTRQLSNMAGAGALGGAFWGLLFGLLFFIPILGMAIGAGMGALAGSLTDVGIDDKFINQVKAEVVPGTSALFLLTTNAIVERVLDAFKGTQLELISTNLPKEQEDRLRAAFEEEPGPEAPASGAAPTGPGPTPSI